MSSSEKVNLILARVFRLPTPEVERNLAMTEVPTWDSLTHMDLITALESELGLQFTGDDIAEMLSFDAIRKTVERYAGSK